MKNSFYLLWLAEIDPERLQAIPALASLMQQGCDVRLAPLPVSEPGQCDYQVLTGMSAGGFGRFDAVRPEGYRVLAESAVPDGALGRTLPDVARMRKLAVTSLDITHLADVEQLAGQSYDLAVLRVRAAGTYTNDELSAFVARWQVLAKPEAHLGVLTDVWAGIPHAHVNLNDFLVDVGLLEVGTPRQPSAIVWTETLAYGLGNGQVWVNMRGREPQGIVSAGREYREVCDAIIRELQTNWHDPQTHEKVVAQVFRKEDLYSGDYLFKAPDLIVVYRPGYAVSAQSFALDFDGQSVLSLTNAPIASVPQSAYGRLLLHGPSLVAGQHAHARLVDVMPNVMYLLQQPVPYGVEGEVLLSLFTSAYQQQNPVQYADDEKDLLSDEEEGMIVDRLRDLGYLG